MPAYIIGHISIKDPATWSDYCSKVPGTIAAWGGELVFRGKKVAVLNGTHGQTDTVVVRFPDTAALTGWHDSADYQALVPLRDAGADVILIAYES
ncbi:hypothetical protein GCM10027343_10980 [Noviherbaspirillum agri]